MGKRGQKATGGEGRRFTPECRKRILDGVRMGATYELAAKYGGVTYRTLRNWLTRGNEDPAGEFRDFYEEFNLAEGEAAVQWLAQINKAAAKSWQAAAWKLERRYPSDYGRTVVQSEHSGPGGGPIEYERKLDLAGLTDEELRILERATQRPDS